MKTANSRLFFRQLALWVVPILFAFSVSCKANAQGDNSLTIEVDAQYMKEHIYDFEASPSVFLYKGDKPAIIDFYATWCGPCRSLAPKLAKVAKEYEGKVIVYKIDIDKNPQLASHFGIESIPTILFVPIQGKPYLSKGNLPMGSIQQMIKKILPQE